MAYGRSTGTTMGGKGGGGLSLKGDATSMGKSGLKQAFGKSGGKGTMRGKHKATKAARAKV